jgi:hypothetical protein
MNRFFRTIKFKTILALGISITPTTAISLFGIVGLSRLGPNIPLTEFKSDLSFDER